MFLYVMRFMLRIKYEKELKKSSICLENSFECFENYPLGVNWTINVWKITVTHSFVINLKWHQISWLTYCLLDRKEIQFIFIFIIFLSFKSSPSQTISFHFCLWLDLQLADILLHLLWISWTESNIKLKGLLWLVKYLQVGSTY